MTIHSHTPGFTPGLSIIPVVYVISSGRVVIPLFSNANNTLNISCFTDDLFMSILNVFLEAGIVFFFINYKFDI